MSKSMLSFVLTAQRYNNTTTATIKKNAELSVKCHAERGKKVVHQESREENKKPLETMNMETTDENSSNQNTQSIGDYLTYTEKILTDDEKQKLKAQDTRLVPDFKAKQLEAQAQRHWDLFYKRNETRFFKDRRWTTREFEELLCETNASTTDKRTQQRQQLLEVGCGVGNLIFPLIEEKSNNYFYYACDFSPRAIEFVKMNPLYDENTVKAFQCDITTEECHKHVARESLDIVTMIFVLSAIHPDKFVTVISNLWRLLKPGGIVLFRDYGLYDMAQLRFKPGHKISENLYMRQDGTRSYYFTEDQVSKLFTTNGFEVLNNSYIHRRTLNVKENVDVPRIFLQGKFRKLPVVDS